MIFGLSGSSACKIDEENNRAIPVTKNMDLLVIILSFQVT
jgi:hypothetical protein